MYIHQEVQAVLLPLLEKYDLSVNELIGLMNQAAAELATLNDVGLQKLIDKYEGFEI